MQTTHTPTPWRVYKDIDPRTYLHTKFVGVAGPLKTVQVALCGKLSNTEAEANAAHIVRCVNSHAALVEALRMCVAAWQQEGEPSAIGYELAIAKAEAALAQAE